VSVFDGATPVATWPTAAAWWRWWWPLVDGLYGLGRSRVEHVLGATEARRVYEASRLRQEPLFCDRALAALDISYITRGEPAALSEPGPLIVVANHPLGALDGLVVQSLVSRQRTDVRCLANRVLERLPDARADMFFVDTMGGSAAASFNRHPLRAALLWLRRGGCLCVFPSGVVSHLTVRRWEVRDGPWHESIARLARATGARIVPCFIEGVNSWTFQIAGLLDPRLRTLLLVRELLRRRGTQVAIRVGSAVGAKDLPADVHALSRELRSRVYALGGVPAASPEPAAAASDTRRRVTIATTARDEAGSLMRRRLLAESEDYRVFWATALQAPALVQEIGRAREETFRAVGEGTGKPVDLDEFDDEYVHLCVWDHQAGELAGAYRMKPLDAAMRAGGSLYTRTLFRFGPGLERSLLPGLELGRAFVRPRYQKQFAPLMLLWTGIGRYVATRTRSRFLFGAVSISASYSANARRLIVAFLRRHGWDAARAGLVQARQPLPPDLDGGGLPDSLEVPADVGALNTAVMAADHEGKGLPVLLRQYLKLHARALGFSIDPSFGYTVDVLMAVDLPRAPESMLRRYMGAEHARVYLAGSARDELSRAG
jgi:putative hemolysin